MKNTCIAILILLAFCRCSTDKTTEEKYTKVKIDMNQIINDVNLNEILSKIEIVPLQTTDSSLVSQPRRLITTDEYIIVEDNQSIVSIFDNNGNFISNSSRRHGDGPEDYGVLIGVAYNKYTQNIDILTPYYLMSYNIYFQFKEKHKMSTYAATESKSGLFFGESFAYEKDKYILLPTPVGDSFKIMLYNSSTEKITKEISYNNDVIAAVTQWKQGINFYDNQNLSFVPLAFSYFLYTINLKDFSLQKLFKLDFGSNIVMADDLKRFNNQREISDYLAFQSSYPLPLRNFFNKKYIISVIKRNSEYYTFIKQIETQKEYLIKNKNSDGKHNIPFFEELQDNVLSSLIQPFDLEKYVDTELLSDKDKKILETIKEDDNPVVVKYYIK